MKSKRHIVLYAVGAIVVLALASVFLMVEKERLSYTPPVIESISTTTAPITPAPTESITPLPERKPFQFEIVTSAAAQSRGLSGRADIPSDYGMLFIFPEKGKHGFWMKDMLASIDILWIRDDGTVIHIDEAVPPSTYPSVFYPPEPVRYVLETRAGESRRQGIEVGTKITLPLPYGQTVSE